MRAATAWHPVPFREEVIRMPGELKPRVLDTTTDPGQAQILKRTYAAALARTAEVGRWHVEVEHHRTGFSYQDGSLWIMLVPNPGTRPSTAG